MNFPLSRSAVNLLIALYENEPATRQLLAVALGHSVNDAQSGLPRLIQLGLVGKRKAKLELSAYDNGDPLPLGKRPFQYYLTREGRNVARLLREATEAIWPRHETQQSMRAMI